MHMYIVLWALVSCVSLLYISKIVWWVLQLNFTIKPWIDGTLYGYKRKDGWIKSPPCLDHAWQVDSLQARPHQQGGRIVEDQGVHLHSRTALQNQIDSTPLTLPTGFQHCRSERAYCLAHRWIWNTDPFDPVLTAPPVKSNPRKKTISGFGGSLQWILLVKAEHKYQGFRRVLGL